jgi:hypothetical protein
MCVLLIVVLAIWLSFIAVILGELIWEVIKITKTGERRNEDKRQSRRNQKTN